MQGIKDKFPHLPEKISGLRELAYNLWWSWHPEGRALFKLLNRHGWYLSNHNPVKMLNRMDDDALKAACEDRHFMRHYDAVIARFESYMNPSSGWLCENVAESERCKIAYFSAEYGLHHALPFYAGVLGFLAGDFLKECSDLGLPLVGGIHVPSGLSASDDLVGLLADGGLRDGGPGECTHQKDGGLQRRSDLRQGAGHGPAHLSGGLEGAGGK